MKTIKLTKSEESTLYTLVTCYYGEPDDAEQRRFEKDCDSIARKLLGLPPKKNDK